MQPELDASVSEPPPGGTLQPDQHTEDDSNPSSGASASSDKHSAQQLQSSETVTAAPP